MIATAKILFHRYQFRHQPDVRHAMVLASGARRFLAWMMFMATDPHPPRLPIKEMELRRADRRDVCASIRVVNPAYPEAG